ncbi:hypothetical protein AMTR_s00070p00186600, partial [Amborella trichopoda]
MSLVDYASSDSEEERETANEEERETTTAVVALPRSSVSPAPTANQNLRFPPQAYMTPNSSTQSIEKLPDASDLFDSPVFSSSQLRAGDHSSRVAAAMAESASRKREANGSVPSLPHRKLPRGNLPPSRISPDTLGGVLLPPQLNGRSNVATEDIDKLFVRRRHEDHTNPP